MEAPQYESKPWLQFYDPDVPRDVTVPDQTLPQLFDDGGLALEIVPDAHAAPRPEEARSTSTRARIRAPSSVTSRCAGSTK